MPARPASPPIFRWRVHDTTSPWKKKGGWRELIWEMSEADATEWAKKNGSIASKRSPARGMRALPSHYPDSGSSADNVVVGGLSRQIRS
jgi:hypothetical protein